MFLITCDERTTPPAWVFQQSPQPRRLRLPFRANFFHLLTFVIPSKARDLAQTWLITQCSKNAPTSIVRSLAVCGARDDSAGNQKMSTVLPTLTTSLTRAASQLASRMQPW